MSIIHVNQIKNRVETLFSGAIDLSDAANGNDEHRTNLLLSRGLAAYAVHFLAEVDVLEAAASIVDGGDDNGIDCLFYSEKTKSLYLVQSKWIHSGGGEPGSGEIKKFVSGVRDLFNMRFERFNTKLRAQQSAIELALNDPATRYELVVVYTGASELAVHSSRDLEDLAQEMNDTSEVVFVTVLNQSALYASLTAAVAGEPINLQIGLKSWGKKELPRFAVYGQLDARQISEWWRQHRARLFARNLRSVLGDTDVNTEMRETLQTHPDEFWYFNNGITILAKRATRAMAGGSDNDFATFHCENVSIVNGAQTVGTIGKYGEGSNAVLDGVFVSVRIIVLGDDQGFAESVTRTNNRQNRIDGRDFVALDPEQSRLRSELAIEGIEYQVMRTESFTRTETAFDLVEATTALACTSENVRLVVQLKREIGKLWDDTTKAPYKEIFNGSVSGLYLWRAVQLQRRIDAALDSRLRRGGSHHHAVRIHGNRLIAGLVFDELPASSLRDPGIDLESVASERAIITLVDQKLQSLSEQLEIHYPNSIVPTLFKNQKKCEHLVRQVKQAMLS